MHRRWCHVLVPCVCMCVWVRAGGEVSVMFSESFVFTPDEQLAGHTSAVWTGARLCAPLNLPSLYTHRERESVWYSSVMFTCSNEMNLRIKNRRICGDSASPTIFTFTIKCRWFIRRNVSQPSWMWHGLWAANIWIMDGEHML